MALTHGIPPDFRGGVHLFFLTAIRHWVSADFIGARNFCVPMTFSAEIPPLASSSQGSSSNGCCLILQVTRDQIICAYIFLHPLIV